MTFVQNQAYAEFSLRKAVVPTPRRQAPKC